MRQCVIESTCTNALPRLAPSHPLHLLHALLPLPYSRYLSILKTSPSSSLYTQSPNIYAYLTIIDLIDKTTHPTLTINHLPTSLTPTTNPPLSSRHLHHIFTSTRYAMTPTTSPKYQTPDLYIPLTQYQPIIPDNTQEPLLFNPFNIRHNYNIKPTNKTTKNKHIKIKYKIYTYKI